MTEPHGFDDWFGTDEWRPDTSTRFEVESAPGTWSDLSEWIKSGPVITEEEIKAAEDAHIEAMHQMALGFMFQDYCRTLSDMFCNDLIDVAEMKKLIYRWCDEHGMELP